MNRYEQMWSEWAQARRSKNPEPAKHLKVFAKIGTLFFFWPIQLFLYLTNRASNATQDPA